MFSAFFGHYLLNKEIITRDQLKQAFDSQDRTHIKLGIMAINEGFMTVVQVEEVHTMQLTRDKLFGALAIESGYLNEEQLKHLISEQALQHLPLDQYLFDKGILSHKAFDDHLMTYKNINNLSDESMEALKSGDIANIVEAFLHFEDDDHAELYKDYVTLFIKNLIRFINRHICMDKASLITKSSYDHMIRQMFYADTNHIIAIAGNTHFLTAFASMSANEKFKVFGEYPIDAIGEYMNQNNGLFVASQSEQGITIRMNSLTHVAAPTLKPTKALYDLPLYCSCGTMHLILGQL